MTLTADVTLQWPLEAGTGSNIVSRIIDVTPSGAYAITMPPADETGTGQVTLFTNLGPSTITVKDNAGGTLLSIASGLSWTIYLTDNSSAAGVWRSFQSGASTAQAQASALAGYGLTAIGSLLAQSQSVVTFNSNYSAGAADRSTAYVWTGGLGTLTLPAASAVGNNWFMSVRNDGAGNLILAAQGSDTINGEASLTFRPGDSATINTDGTSFYTVGLGQDPVFAFDFTSIDLTGRSGAYTLSGAEINRIAYDFVGVLAGNVEIVVPSTTQQYWIANDTTGGSYTLGVRTSAQSPAVTVNRGSRGIYYSQGSAVVNADTASIASPIAIADGGTGATTASGARINLGGTAVGVSLFTAASAAVARATLAAAGSGANSDITALSGLTTPLSVAQGGTGAATLTGLAKGAGTAAFVAATPGTDYLAPGVATTFTAKQTFAGSAANLAVKLVNALEKVTTLATAATGTINFDVLTQSVVYYTLSASANWTLNLRGDGSSTLDSLMATGESVTVAFLVTQGATPYYNSVLQVDGATVGVTTKWQGGAPSAGSASGVDVYSFVVVKTGAATFSVFASRSAFS